MRSSRGVGANGTELIVGREPRVREFESLAVFRRAWNVNAIATRISRVVLVCRRMDGALSSSEERM